MKQTATKRQKATVLRRAAKALEEYGWIRGYLGSRQTGFCLVGSVDFVRGDCSGAIGALDKYINRNRNRKKKLSIPEFNDFICKGKIEAIATLRHTARWLEHGGG